MDIPTIRPTALRPGNTIQIVAPAGPIEAREALEKGIATLQRLGFAVRFDQRIFQVFRYLAGDDRSRADELMNSFEDPEVRAIVTVRGGFGCSRLIHLLNEKRLRPHCKIFVGFSDLTTLHLYFQRRFRWVTFHGPMATSPALASLSSEQGEHLFKLWTDPEYRPVLTFPQLESWHGGTGEGVLIGGCLSLIAASLGTSYEIKTEGKILFLEDLGEPSYRVDRMLTQLQLAGKLSRIEGIILGGFHECTAVQGSYTIEDTLKEVLSRFQVPIVAKFPAGHGAQNWAIPLGVPIRLDADQRTIEFLEPAVRAID